MLAGPLRQVGLRLKHTALQCPRGLKQQVVFVTHSGTGQRARQQDEIDHSHSVAFPVAGSPANTQPGHELPYFHAAAGVPPRLAAVMPLNLNENLSILPRMKRPRLRPRDWLSRRARIATTAGTALAATARASYAEPGAVQVFHVQPGFLHEVTEPGMPGIDWPETKCHPR
jgi:hypothetical protein